MTAPKKLIEVALPVREISAESVRDKSIRHGHISTLHLWWARRPLPVCRAVVFASLVPDPLDEHCPQAFREAVGLLLGKDANPGDPYKPYDDIPYTSAIDPMEDNLRNRLLMFIGKFSDTFIQHERSGKATPAKDQLSDASLIKWDNKNNDEILNKARKLIWVAHNSGGGEKVRSGEEMLRDFHFHWTAIKEAEYALYEQVDRHLDSPHIQQLTAYLEERIEAFLDKMPRVFDPFAGGGAIPLEAARLGCRSYGNDINPVAHIIQKGSLEFPQKYGKPITYSNAEFIKRYGEEEFQKIPQENRIYERGEGVAVHIPNRLSFDVDFYARKLLRLAEAEIGHFYPADEKGNKPIAYYWARVGTCSNPSCKAEVPLLKGFYLCNKKDKQVYLKPVIEGTKIEFEKRQGSFDEEGWVRKRKLVCPCCGNTTDTETIRSQSINKEFKEKLIAVIEEGENGKNYRKPFPEEFSITQKIPEAQTIHEEIVKGDSRNLWLTLWGINTWGDMFSPRQLLALQTLVAQLQTLKEELRVKDSEYGKAVVTYLGVWIDRIVAVQTSFGRWDVGFEKIQTPFARQAIPMIFDYPEGNIFSNSTGSALNHLSWIVKYIESESTYAFAGSCINASSGDKSQFPDKYISSVVTDPPYYDAIAYADISDFFYVWLKRTLGDVFPLNFATPQTPKTEECTALKHHHKDKDAAKHHFENKLMQIFDAIEHQTSDIVSIMFAHQSTEAWTTLCNSILGARMNITGSWAIDTELANRSIGLAGAALESSVTVACRPSQKQGYGEYKPVRKEIEATVAREVEELYRLGFRGADLLTACFGKAVSVFGQYQKVEKADGSEVTVAELLEMAKESAFNALLKGFDGDDYTKFYIGWLQLYGFTESDFDDAAKFSRVGLSINVGDLFAQHILIKNGNKQTLGAYEDRLGHNKKLGEDRGSFLIDQVHRAMALYKGANRGALLGYIADKAASPENSFWRVVTSLCEVLPPSSDDHKQATGLLTNKDSLIRESKLHLDSKGTQTKLEF